jgi:hypothetical protein
LCCFQIYVVFSLPIRWDLSECLHFSEIDTGDR